MVQKIMVQKIKLTTILTATALALLLSSSALAEEVFSETATGMVNAAVQAICDGDKDRHLAMHQRKIEPDPYYDEKFSAFHEACKENGITDIEIITELDDALMQEQKRRFHIDANILMGDGALYATTFRVVWGAFGAPAGSNPVEAWRLGGLSRVEVPILRDVQAGD
ncbi:MULTISPECIES: hypothetical protein [unclassified Halomonas]|uniref:hypothetical protein n=1 Tax=unclassified Halomonas TaxID=2609666 RepID=UPI0007D98CF7|nr:MULTISPECIES: hypothetical protein [unclassified Halomonas]MBT2787330.1 hypothetical protein [Halomonas sp. ISL-106]MBT2796308.1 hypothetical protein [Halomonas sp. ISL-104]OAL57543.1 hypothetical protein A6R74_12275 [Halomonas sp. ALS9]